MKQSLSLLARYGLMACLLAMVAPDELFASDDLPPYVLRWPDSIETILLADAESSTLTRYSRADGRLVADAVYMSVGQRGVGKQREGDRRTPLGIYFVTEQLDTSDLDPMYGVTAFPLDYPNAMDERLNRDGGGIWLHGVLPDSGRRPPRDTDGCLAIGNAALLELAPTITPQITPVVITESLATAPGDEELREIATTIEDGLQEWLAQRQSGNTFALAQLYADGYERGGLTKTQWIQLWAEEPRRKDGSLERLFIAADPADAGLFVSRFRLKIDGFASDKRLYWRRQPDGQLRIVAEDEW